MSFAGIGFGDEDLFDFDGNGKLDTFETALMLDEQDREMEAMFGNHRSAGDDLDNDFDEDIDSDDDFDSDGLDF